MVTHQTSPPLTHRPNIAHAPQAASAQGLPRLRRNPWSIFSQWVAICAGNPTRIETDFVILASFPLRR